MSRPKPPIARAASVALLPVLGFWDLVIYGMTYVSPIGPWSTWGYASALSGGAAPAAYGLGALALLFTALSYAQMSVAVPEGGSAYAYAGAAMGRVAGFMAGWMILLDYLLLPALMYVFFALSMTSLLPAVPSWVWILTAAGYNLGVNLIGIRTSARLNMATLLVQFLMLVAVIGVVLHAATQGHVPLFTSNAWWGPSTSVPTLFSATSLCVMAYLGFDAVTTLTTEVRPHQRHLVGRALLLCLMLIGALAVLQVWIYSDLARGMTFADPATATFELVAEKFDPTFAGVLTWATSLIVALSITPTMVTGVSRVLHAMARQGELPALLGRTHPTRAVPHMAILASGALSIGVALVFASSFDTLTSLVNFGAICAFISVNASVIVHFSVNQRSRHWALHRVVPIVGILLLLAVLSQMPALSLAVGLIWMGLGAVAVRTGALSALNLPGKTSAS
jgi:amino acid transporter